MINILLNFRMTRDTGTGDESSYSSFSSFLKTDDSMKSLDETENGFIRKESRWDKMEKDYLQPLPIRKVRVIFPKLLFFFFLLKV